jgi:glutamate carboxypeptidase
MDASTDAAPDALMERLRRYVAMESPTGDRAALRAFTDAVTDRLTESGGAVSWDEHESGDNAVVSVPGSPDRQADAPLVLLLHTDTVWPRGQVASMPWSVEDGIARGPGVFDMKGGIVVVEEAVANIASGSHRPIVIVLVADEEIGSPNARALIETVCAGAHAVLGFEPSHPDGALKTARWGSTRIRISVEGREAHAALDAAFGVSAIDELVDQLVQIRELTADAPGVLCNVGTITGGSRTNVVAGAAEAELGLRFRDAETESDILARLMDRKPVRPGAIITARVLSNRPTWQPDAMHDALLASIALAGVRCGQEITGGPATGAADTNLTGNLGVPSIDGLGPIGSGAHAVTEQIVVSSLAERIALVSSILTAL